MSPRVREIAWKAQTRLTARYRALSGRGKKTTVVCTAIARELVGFMWSVAREARPPEAARHLSLAQGRGRNRGRGTPVRRFVAGQGTDARRKTGNAPEAELHRLKGAVLAETGDVAEAVAWFQQALDTARSLQAKSLELRAATSLARLWGAQGRRAEAHDLLAPIFGWFTEGFDTQDLKDAKVLLDELHARPGRGSTDYFRGNGIGIRVARTLR